MNEILDVIQGYLRKIKRSGNENIMALCPFHSKSDGSEEKTPSFSMNVMNGLWYCHSCHERGNLYTFLRNVGIPRAEIDFRYKALIEEAENHAPQRPDPLSPTQATSDFLPESFLGMFDMCPQGLLDEGYPEALLQSFDIGFDEKHQRITFPLRDPAGRLVGISGRAVEKWKKPRYKIYDKEFVAFGLQERRIEKRAVLWNVHNVYRHFAFVQAPSDRYVVVTEGFKAALRVVQGGIPSVVALIGSYLSNEQLWLITKLGVPVLLMLDNNDAGQAGQRDAARRLSSCCPHVHVVPYGADQPSDLSAEDVQSAILSAEPYISWLLRQDL